MLGFLRSVCAVSMLVSAGVCLPGCTSFLGRVMVTAPNDLTPLTPAATASPAARSLMGVDQQFAVEVGPPTATLSISVVEPEERTEPRGTVLVLHGIWASSVWMLGTAHRLSEDGFRAVLVDLRGHGRSGGDGLTYGQREAEDVSQVIDELQRRKLVVGPLGIYGISYGATTSIHVAGIDPRIRAVVAVAPFSAMRDVVPDYSRTVLPGVERLISDETLQEAVDVAGELSQFDPDKSTAIAAIRKTTAPALIVHGTEDWLVPPYHAVRLHEVARDHSKLVFVPYAGYVTIWFDPSGTVAQEASDWFLKTLGP
ncbi:MAG: hypothetical protein CMJ48_11395 [Planctomycetaceae bacterium]|nr:hypothetical protein [Planctomycetaceae bacterium]